MNIFDQLEMCYKLDCLVLLPNGELHPDYTPYKADSGELNTAYSFWDIIDNDWWEI